MAAAHARVVDPRRRPCAAEHVRVALRARDLPAVTPFSTVSEARSRVVRPGLAMRRSVVRSVTSGTDECAARDDDGGGTDAKDGADGRGSDAGSSGAITGSVAGRGTVGIRCVRFRLSDMPATSRRRDVASGALGGVPVRTRSDLPHGVSRPRPGGKGGKEGRSV